MTTQRQLAAEAKRLARILEERGLKIVFAESCTGGLISAAMTRVPGISAYHCGSAVVYQIETKTRWLGIPAETLVKPGPVSRTVAALMAANILSKTPHADVSAAVTGHLGPDAPKRQDGLIYAAVARRDPRRRTVPPEVVVKKHHLIEADPAAARGARDGSALRIRRQISAARFVLSMVRTLLESDRRPN